MKTKRTVSFTLFPKTEEKQFHRIWKDSPVRMCEIISFWILGQTTKHGISLMWNSNTITPIDLDTQGEQLCVASKGDT